MKRKMVSIATSGTSQVPMATATMLVTRMEKSG
jgi:hypothetical protein